MIVQTSDCICQKHHVIGCTRESHNKQYRSKSYKPLGIHIREELHQYFCHNSGFTVYEFVAGHKHHAAVDQCSHKSHTEYLRAFNIKVFCKQHDQDTGNIYSNYRSHCQNETVFQTAYSSCRSCNFFNSFQRKLTVFDKHPENQIDIRKYQERKNEPYQNDLQDQPRYIYRPVLYFCFQFPHNSFLLQNCIISRGSIYKSTGSPSL